MSLRNDFATQLAQRVPRKQALRKGIWSALSLLLRVFPWLLVRLIFLLPPLVGILTDKLNR